MNEVIIVDASEHTLHPADLSRFSRLTINYLVSKPSVCLQRNIGIRAARSPWIFICDDDIEMPADYLSRLSRHIQQHNEAGAVSGIILQKEKGEWVGRYDIKSKNELIAKYIFGLSVWGNLACNEGNFIIRRIIKRYQKRGNYISKAGWPVITDFSGEHFATPVYGLGAALVKKEWLELSPYDEVLDSHGIGDNYGVALGFPSSVHVVIGATVLHHQEPLNRLQKPLQYYRRVLALHYFIKTKKCPSHVKTHWLLWSLFGNILLFALTGDELMTRAATRTFLKIIAGKNPYFDGKTANKKIVEPQF